MGIGVMQNSRQQGVWPRETVQKWDPQQVRGKPKFYPHSMSTAPHETLNEAHFCPRRGRAWAYGLRVLGPLLQTIPSPQTAPGPRWCGFLFFITVRFLVPVF